MARKSTPAKPKQGFEEHDRGIPPPPTTQALARELKACYVAAYKQKFPTARLNPRSDSMKPWHALAAKCEEERVNPTEFITFALAMRGAETALPESLSTPRVWCAWKERAGFHDTDVIELVAMELRNTRQVLWNLVRTWEINEQTLPLLRAPFTGITPYIRILLAPDDEGVWVRHGYEAVQALLANPALREACKHWQLPVERVLAKPSPPVPEHIAYALSET